MGTTPYGHLPRIVRPARDASPHPYPASSSSPATQAVPARGASSSGTTSSSTVGMPAADGAGPGWFPGTDSTAFTGRCVGRSRRYTPPE